MIDSASLSFSSPLQLSTLQDYAMLGTLGKGEDILYEENLCAVIPGFVHGSGREWKAAGNVQRTSLMRAIHSKMSEFSFKLVDLYSSLEPIEMEGLWELLSPATV